jgi:hypothetical protein
MPQLLSGVYCTVYRPLLSNIPHKKRKGREDSIQVNVWARELELHVRDQSGVQDNFPKTTGALVML